MTEPPVSSEPQDAGAADPLEAAVAEVLAYRKRLGRDYGFCAAVDIVLDALAKQRAAADMIAAEREAWKAQATALKGLVEELLEHSISHYGNVKDETFGIGLTQARARTVVGEGNTP